MRLPGENEERSAGLSIKYILIGASLCILLILGVVLLTDYENTAKKKKNEDKEIPVLALEHEESGSEPEEESVDGTSYSYGSNKMREIERLYEENKLKASDLDFWDMYPANELELVKDTEEDKEKEDDSETEDKYSQYDEEQEDDPAKDGKHTLLRSEEHTSEL